MVEQTQLVDPHLHTLDLSGIVAHAYHHGFHLSECRITHDGDLVVGMVGVVGRIGCREGSHALRLGLVARLLECGEDGERHVEHVLLGPHGTAVLVAVSAVVVACRCELQRYFVLVVVVLVVASQTDEHRSLVVLQRGDILLQGIGVYKHLHAFVLSQVEGGVLVHRLGLARAQVLGHEAERLLVGLDELWLRGVLLALYARWQHVVDRCLLGILLYAHRTGLERAAVGSAQQLVIGSPLAPYQVECTETQHDGLAEVGEEHAHEAYAGEVVDVAFLLLVLVYGNTELIPGDGGLAAVAQRGRVASLVDDEVGAHLQVFGTYAHVILIVFLVFVEGEVLVDVLHVGRRLVGSVVALGAAVAVGRVALWVVDKLVSVEYGRLHLVPVAATVVVIVVACRVIVDAVEHRLVHLALYLAEVSVLVVLAFLLVVESVESHVLQCAASLRCGEGIGHGALCGNLSPLCVGEV